jgi:hypothetical protein
MKRGFIAAIFLLAGLARPVIAQSECSRDCLQDFVNQYLKAIVAHDPARLPLAKNARYTENGQASQPPSAIRIFILPIPGPARSDGVE